MEGSYVPPGAGGSGEPPTPTPPPPPFEGYGAPPPTPPPSRPPIPWEEKGRDFMSGLFETVRLIFTSPAEAFRRVPLDTELLRPILFAIIVGWIGMAASAIYESLFQATIWQFLPGMADREDVAFGIVGSLITIIFAPLFVGIGLLISSAITHLMLLLLGAGTRGWTATFRVLCYASTSTLLALIPIAGGFLNLIANILFSIVGLSEVHGCSRGRAAAAVLLPLVLCCGIGIFFFVLFGAAMIAAFSGMGG